MKEGDIIMSETIHNRIKRLRKEKNLTQLQLAETLNVTDKAVSKWESSEGNPDISLLSSLSIIFGVSIDYLLTGKDSLTQTKFVSRFEQCAKTTDLALYEDIKASIIASYNNNPDEQGKTLDQYVLENENVVLFEKMLSDGLIHLKDYQRIISGLPIWTTDTNDTKRTKELFLKFVKLAFISNHPEAITFQLGESGIGTVFNLAHHSLTAWKLPYNELYLDILQDDFFELITTNSKIADQTLNFILNKDSKGLHWFAGFPHLVHYAFKNNRTKLFNDLLNLIEKINKETFEKLDDDYQSKTILSPGLLIWKESKTIYSVSSFILEETIRLALDRFDYELVTRLNQINTAIQPLSYDFELFIASEYLIRMVKTNNNPKLSKKEKLTQSVIKEGLVDIDGLLELNSYELYEELIEKPCSYLEVLYNLIKKNQLKELFEFALKHNLSQLIDKLKMNNLSELLPSIEYEKLFPNNSINFHYFSKYIKHSLKKDSDIELLINAKRIILQEKLLQLKDPRFYDLFVDYYLKYHHLRNDDFDRVLEQLVTQQPDAYDAQRIMLEAGAKLHRRWVENEGDEYEERFDEIDEVATQLLKNQIQIILKKEGK